MKNLWYELSEDKKHMKICFDECTEEELYIAKWEYMLNVYYQLNTGGNTNGRRK